jgi:hypothetical protein
MPEFPQQRPWRRTLALALIAVTGAAPIVLAQTAPAQSPAAGTAAPAAKTFPQEKLDQLLAPVALYPDSLLAHVMMASTYPLEVVQAERWVKANPSLKDKALEDALQKQPWDAAVKSLTKFPQVLTMMSEKLDWTQELGDAFLAQKEDVAKTVQALRAKAQAQGNLKDSKEQKVVSEPAGTTTIIKIEPANPQVVYVPTYNPTVVYGSWWYPSYPPYYYYPPGYVAGGALLGFTAGVIVGGALWGNYNWGGGDIDIDINRHNEFNRTNNVSNKEWKHDASHRGAVPYKDKAVAAQNNRAGSAGAAQRDAYRGREGGAQAGTMDRGGAQAGAANRAGGAQAGSMDRAGGADFGRGADSVSNRAGAGAGTGASATNRSSGGYQGAGASSRDMGGGGSAFNTGSRAQTQSYSNRGASSMGASRSGGGARAGGGGGGGRGGRR